MSENEKNNEDFEFIKEQVLEKKHKKFKKWFLPLLMTVLLAVLFGVIAAVTFCVAEPRLYKLLHKEEESKTPISFPTEYPDDSSVEDITKGPDVPTDEKEDFTEKPTVDVKEPQQVIVERTIDADIDAFIDMHEDIKKTAYTAGKTIVQVSSIINDKDWFGKPIERKIDTTGVVIFNDNVDLFILVSLDRVLNSNSIKVVFTEAVSVDAILQDYESEINLAVIAVKLEDIPSIFRSNIRVATLGESYTIAVSNPIIALGNPNGHPFSVEVGYVTSKSSGINLTDNRLDLFNTNLRDNEYSDGIIINMKGQMIGMITRTLKEGVNKELHTAIGISKLKPIIQRMANQQARIYLGVKAEDLTEDAKKEHNVESGIYVNEVQPKSPAFSGGMKNGDIILQVNDEIVLNLNKLNNIISTYQPESKITVKIKRTTASTEKEMDLEITLAAKAK